MDLRIDALQQTDLEAVVALSLSAWEPVFASLRAELDPEVFGAFYPDGWEASQRAAVIAACTAADHRTWVGVAQDRIVGFVNTYVHPDLVIGEIHMIAVHPDHQHRGTGLRLTTFALERLAESGARVAMVETGGDAGHEPARHTYVSAGFRLLPIARYFKKL